ncbi:hypothetical protein VB712_03315 [Spirulina sp. CCNP1310]|uniref:hypothetical protein n=1 Tax=Spirulina sp. CCNP1310 TaxID=3110249 RepID=UPI002B210C4A|nr:hypothetical protein [Spirulina sp. CCNP1310]MEA5418239.1 hypothetical protein [Spirulina sp. CCNP1310]
MLNIQEKRNKLSAGNDALFHIKVQASNGKNLDLKISGEMTKKKIKLYQKLGEDFVNEFLSVDDGKYLKKLGSSEIAEINLLFERLKIELTDIRVLVSLPSKKVENVTTYSCDFEKINLTEAIKRGSEEPFYLKVNDTERCKNIFYILERENILGFHEDSTDARFIEVENEFIGFVGYRIEILSLFEDVVSNKSFNLHDEF